MLELPFRWGAFDGCARVEVEVNDDPVALGCSEVARGFPYCRATVEHPGIGYADVLGWVQLVESSLHEAGFHLDYFEPMGVASHPFAFYGLAPTFFDAPHTDEDENWDFLAHSFLCGLGGELLDEQRGIRAILGFSWGFSKRGNEFEYLGPAVLAAADWDGHRPFLGRSFPNWQFATGFHRHPLRP
jgi:hypothetical protein